MPPADTTTQLLDLANKLGVVGATMPVSSSGGASAYTFVG